MASATPTREMGSQGPPVRPEPDIEQLLNASKYFLCHRNFNRSLKYADRAQQSNPNHPGPPQILAISTVLSASPSPTGPETPDWYSILNLPRFTDDPNLIRTRFDSLSNLLNPVKNPYPFAAEAHGWVSQAGSLLSNPNAKALFDKQLKLKQRDTENGGGTFWTVCPYCYFMYEYDKIYEECVLRCHNEKCRRAFTAVAVAEESAPPPEVVEKGKYFCHGVSPLGPKNGSGGESGEGKEKKRGSPFESMDSDPGPGSGQVNENKVGVETNEELKGEKNDNLIEISDGEMEGEEAIKKRDAENGVYVVMKRKKMAAKGRKKLMGKGIRVEDKLKAETKEDSVNTSGGMENCNVSEFEFSAAEDDIFVYLKSDGDLGLGNFGA